MITDGAGGVLQDSRDVVHSMRGAMFWMTFDGTMNSALFTEFLDLLLHDIDGKIFLIVDNVRYHTARENSEWVEERKDRIELFFLPSYSLISTRTSGHGKREERPYSPRGPAAAWPPFEIARRALRRLYADPAKIRAFIGDPHLAYIHCAYA
jgi:hypothetical protein